MLEDRVYSRCLMDAWQDNGAAQNFSNDEGLIFAGNHYDAGNMLHEEFRIAPSKLVQDKPKF